MNQSTASLPQLSDQHSPQAILRAGLQAAGGPVALACSFSVEDVVIIDLLQEVAPATPIFALDTGRLNEETYETAEAVRERYGVHIDWYFPERAAVEQLERDKGLFSFRESLENRKECCRIRKVEPLGRALAGLSGWITGLRREQSVTRDALEPLEIDAAHGGILKINPLAFWSSAQVWEYAERRRIPVNRLHRQGYPSIGCAPCTRAVQPGEDERAGRWWWENPEHKECGLHRR
ncbi:phosphoadenylyl-sulfate reductase [Geoalkalibacter halelectricus]|uniref:Adenosine 5'-phosphosulfate reductase n=1 Tax=Geoalkalibacter halelectricus TaxID=2847045 RepID=A0ABY5ZRJ2_9BACT|nr:phosphoadenylyl-sulfate reductase [Geoalkalibacter halelectricus]MDO3377670.1 phosphoadenylyl-sulfate reductase [Geoalkalibacter halelectricus]UWZ81459.1 phosphoadenylyl-sulfate reductase [Geoalkalibacter halelectricus]